jgi:hypothetical protein
MKRLLMAAALVLVTASAALAQAGGGSITGTVQDEQGGVLPGVTVTLAGTDRTTSAVTDEAGRFRFLNLAPGMYKVTAALTGFSTIVREDVEVRVGANADLPFNLKVATVEETITVTGESPLVDTRATGTATNFTQAELDKIPTSRDPWALLRTVPGVLVDRVNIAGNETGQQSNISSKGTRPQDVVWTMDGVEITDMAAVGASPTYFNYDDFEEIQVSTAGQDIRQRTGGAGLNMVVKRGTNQLRGQARGYFTNDSLESENVPDELQAIGVTPEQADHNDQISEYGVELGGPIWRDKAWFYGSFSQQDVRLVRRSGALIDRTILKNPNVKLNWQATKNDMVNFLFFNGDKIKEGRSPGASGINFDAQTATWNQSNAYTDHPLHGLWKLEDNHTFGSSFFLTSKYAYYNTGFILDPIGGLEETSGRSLILSRSFGSVSRGLNVRPQHTVNVDGSAFMQGLGASHDIKVGFGWRRADGAGGTLWPGNGFLALENSLTDFRVQVFREGFGGNRVFATNFYVGDTIQKGRATIDLGIRYDRQTGKALPSQTQSNAAFPNLVPGIVFDGYEAPFKWNNISPRAGVTVALDEARKTIVRAAFSRYASQLNTGAVGFSNPSSGAGWAAYRWNDLNADHLATANEVLTNQFITAGAGFNPAAPTSVSSANVIDADLEAPVTTSFVTGVDREVVANLAVQVNYSYTRTTNHFGNPSFDFAPRTGVDLDDYAPGPAVTGTLPGSGAYSIPTFIPNAAAVAAGGNGFFLTNWSGYSTDYSGLELSMVKRMSNRWMARVGFSFNNAREHFDGVEARRNRQGNPTPTDTETLIDGGQYARLSGGSGSGDIFVNAKWQFNANGVYVLPYNIDAGLSVFGRQGYPFVPFRQTALGADSVRVLIVPEIDTFRLENLWNTDLRFAKRWDLNRGYFTVIADLFNVFNANTALVRNRNAAPAAGSTSGEPGPTFRTISQNLSPRIWRFGVKVGF